METEPLLLKNWGTWRVQSDDQCNDYHRDCQNQQAQERTYYVKSTLRYQVQLLLFQYRFCYLNDHIGRALLCQTAARCCCHISHIPTLISVSLPPIGSARSRPGAKALHRYLICKLLYKNIHSRCAIQVSTASAIAA